MAGFNPNTWPTFQQSMPMAKGAMTGEALQRAYLQNQRQKQQNQVQPDMDSAKLLQIQQQNQFQPDLNAARLAQMKSATQGQDISNQQAPESLGLKEYMAKIAAQNSARGMQNIDLQRDKMGALYGNMMSRLSNTPAAQVMISQNPNVASNLLSGIGGATQNFSQAQVSPLSAAPAQVGQPYPQQQMRQPQEQQQISSPNFPALQQYMQGGQPSPQPQQQIVSPSQQYMQGAQGGQQGISQTQSLIDPAQQQVDSAMQQGQSSESISPDLIKQAQDATMSKMIKQTTPDSVQKQRYFTQTFDNFADQITDIMPILSQYSGVKGQIKLKGDQIDALKGIYNPDYEKYITFKTFTAPNAANELKRSLQGQASDKEMEVMMKMIDPSMIATNPKLYEQRWNNLVEQSKGISDIASKSLAQVTKMGQQPQVRNPSLSVQAGSSAPAGTVEMIDENGKFRPVPSDQLQAAIKHGWRQA